MNRIKPIKAKAAEVFCDGEIRCAAKVLQHIVSDYPNEKYCSIPTISAHLKSLKAAGILAEDASYLDESGNLVSVYRITDYGKNKVQKIS